MTKEEYKNQFKEDDAVGWLCIDKEFERLYPGQEPKHFRPLRSYILGGEDPLDGISIYESNKQTTHLHFISYGFSELYYDEEKAGGEFSKWGFELSFRLAPFAPDNGEPAWVFAFMQNLAKYVFNNNKWFEEFHFIPANSPIRLNTETNITAVAFVLDPEIPKLETPHGELSILQMVGLTNDEYEMLALHPKKSETEKLLNKLQQDNPLLITDLNRK